MGTCAAHWITTSLNQCSTTGRITVVVCIILPVELCIKRSLAGNKNHYDVVLVGFISTSYSKCYP